MFAAPLWSALQEYPHCLQQNARGGLPPCPRRLASKPWKPPWRSACGSNCASWRTGTRNTAMASWRRVTGGWRRITRGHIILCTDTVCGHLECLVSSMACPLPSWTLKLVPFLVSCRPRCWSTAPSRVPTAQPRRLLGRSCVRIASGQEPCWRASGAGRVVPWARWLRTRRRGSCARPAGRVGSMSAVPLIHACLEAPGDPLARAILADYLEDHSDPRATLFRAYDALLGLSWRTKPG